MTSTRIFLVQIASVPGYQVGQRQFEQSQYLHDLLVKTLIGENENQPNRKQICALKKIAPKHRIVLRSGFSQTAQWGLEPNMFLEVEGDENLGRIIGALFGQAFCQDGIGIGGHDIVQGEEHTVFTIDGTWKNEQERLKLVSCVLEKFPNLSAQLDVENRLTFHDYSLVSASNLDEIKSFIETSLRGTSEKSFVVEQNQMKSELIDRNDYQDLLRLLEYRNARRTLNILRNLHARLFSGYPCASLDLPKFSFQIQRRNRHSRREKWKVADLTQRSAPHLCSLIFNSYRVCMCLTDYNCFCNYSLIITTHAESSSPNDII